MWQIFFSFRYIISKTIKNMQNSDYWQKQLLFFSETTILHTFDCFGDHTAEKSVKRIQNSIGLKFVTSGVTNFFFLFVEISLKRQKVCTTVIFDKNNCYFFQKKLFLILLIVLEIIQRKKNRKRYPEWHWTKIFDAWCDEYCFFLSYDLQNDLKYAE